ncbi:TPA: GIY-YIG nuclease family protein [Thermoplasmata archaeon]|nr:GIY-YIG nuclease family protein [Thermoplasmata archaeon]
MTRKLNSGTDHYASWMKGVYCLLMVLDEDASIRVGALGGAEFPRGVYAYVGSAQRGIEQRVRRHLLNGKKRRWHIDYFLSVARVATVVSIPTLDRSTECLIARNLLNSPGAEAVAKGFGSSDCSCVTHLIHFSGEDIGLLLEEVAGRISMLCTPYPETVKGG